MSEVLLGEFDSKAGLYSRVTDKAASLIQELLSEYEINVHSVTSRTKERHSLAKKLSKQGRAYKDLADITDISGVRIITYFEQDVDRVVQVLYKEFEIDEENSIDKRLMLDPDRFGYISTHHVVRLNKIRSELHEYRWFQNNCVEIQTRSILQHAWAEIEHDLGYKSKKEVPKEIRRKFSRLAGLLELADSEFNAIRAALVKYDMEVVDKIQVNPNAIGVNRSSLVAFSQNSEIMERLDKVIAKAGSWELVENDDHIASYVDRLDDLGVKTIGDLERSLYSNAAEIENFATGWLARPRDEDYDGNNNIHTGISIFYLIYILLARAGDKNAIAAYFIDSDITADDPEKTAQEVLDIYAASLQKNPQRR